MLVESPITARLGCGGGEKETVALGVCRTVLQVCMKVEDSNPFGIKVEGLMCFNNRGIQVYCKVDIFFEVFYLPRKLVSILADS